VHLEVGNVQEVLVHAVTTVVRRAAVLTIAVNAGASAAAAQSPQGPWAAVDRAIGRVGSTQPGEVQRYSFPRSDLHVTLDGVTVKPALALGSWVAFKRMNGSGAVTAMGDLVLLEGEVTPVISRLQSMGVEETALHNHLQREIPAVMYLHIQAHGDPIEIARAIRAALALTRTPTVPSAAALGGAFDLDTAGWRQPWDTQGR